MIGGLRLKRAERIAAITKILCDNPGKIHTIGEFCEMLDSARSSISEDIDRIQEAFEKLHMGKIRTISGAAGGIQYIPYVDLKYYENFAEHLCKILSQKERIISGNFIYTTDVIYNPQLVDKVAQILAYSFLNVEADYVVTIETKGIPIAFAVARLLKLPLAVIRQENKVTEGPVVSINYVSGSTRNIRTMYLSKKSIKMNSNVIIIDDFMKAGGTAKGILDMMKEFDSRVVGIGVFIATKYPAEKLVSDYVSVLQLNTIDEKKGIIDIQIGDWVKNFKKIEDFQLK